MMMITSIERLCVIKKNYGSLMQGGLWTLKVSFLPKYLLPGIFH